MFLCVKALTLIWEVEVEVRRMKMRMREEIEGNGERLNEKICIYN